MLLLLLNTPWVITRVLFLSLLPSPFIIRFGGLAVRPRSGSPRSCDSNGIGIRGIRRAFNMVALG